MTLDDTDYRLLAILRDNARTPVTSLAHALGVSRGTVQNRIDKLLENGIIRGFTIRLKPESEPHAIRAMTPTPEPWFTKTPPAGPSNNL